MKVSDLLQNILHEIEDGIVALDGDSLVLFANNAFISSFTEGKKDIAGKRLQEVITEPDLLGAIKMGLASTSQLSSEVSSRGKNLRIRLIPSKEGLICFLRDITEEKRLEKIKRDFVSNVSHELRTPLASIKGYTETLIGGAVSDKENALRFLRIIGKNSERMSLLIDDLLILSRIETHDVPLSLKDINLNESIKLILQSFDKQASDKDISLKSALKEENLICVADRERIEQVLVNLIDNAIKYTPKYGSVVVEAYSVEEGARVDVTDTGIGIPKKDIHRVFERFYRVDKARSRELGGTGLGLAIVKHIIISHRGRVWVESTEGKGSRFSFIIPKF